MNSQTRIINLFTLIASFILISLISMNVFLTSILAVIIFLIFLIFLFKNEKDFFLINAYMFYALFSTLLLSLTLEKPIYLIEIDRFTYPLHVPEKALIQLLLFSIGSLTFFYFGKRTNYSVKNLTTSSNFLIKNFFRSLVIICIVIISLIALRYGTPLTHGVHRNDYWTYIAPSWGGAITYWVMQFNFLLGYFYSQKKTKLDLTLFITVLITIFLMGERFTGLMYSLFFFMLPILLNKQKINLNVSKSKMITILIVGFSAISFILYNNFSKIDAYTSPIQSILIRASLQPQMWWALDEITTFNSHGLDIIFERYFGLTSDARNQSVYYLMDQVAPKSIVDARFTTNSRFTMSGIFNNTFIFGYLIGSIINYLWGCFFGLIAYIFYKGILAKNIIFVFFAFKLFFKMQAMLLNGTIPDLFTLETTIFISGCLLFSKLTQKN